METQPQGRRHRPSLRTRHESWCCCPTVPTQEGILPQGHAQTQENRPLASSGGVLSLGHGSPPGARQSGGQGLSTQLKPQVELGVSCLSTQRVSLWGLTPLGTKQPSEYDKYPCLQFLGAIPKITSDYQSFNPNAVGRYSSELNRSCTLSTRRTFGGNGGL